MTNFDIIIPARYASTRLPGKPLRDVAGKTLIERVYECALQSQASNVYIATDDKAILRVAQEFGAQVVMTSASHDSGTDRLAEVVDRLGIDDDRIVVNLQGDEPLVPSQLIIQVVEALESDPTTAVSTVCKDIRNQHDYCDPSVVKVVLNKNGYALYFSRAPLPWARDNIDESGWPIKPTSTFHHVGLYAYRAGYLRRFSAQNPCELETTEKLEQLRALWNDEKIRVVKASCLPGPGVDTLDDLEHVIRIFEQQMQSQ
jgi:3-deoxy-manno-octulosonate cytidylyltransferase (CMP-KDO synthetase)